MGPGVNTSQRAENSVSAERSWLCLPAAAATAVRAGTQLVLRMLSRARRLAVTVGTLKASGVGKLVKRLRKQDRDEKVRNSAGVLMEHWMLLIKQQSESERAVGSTALATQGCEAGCGVKKMGVANHSKCWASRHKRKTGAEQQQQQQQPSSTKRQRTAGRDTSASPRADPSPHEDTTSREEFERARCIIRTKLGGPPTDPGHALRVEAARQELHTHGGLHIKGVLRDKVPSFAGLLLSPSARARVRTRAFVHTLAARAVGGARKGIFVCF